MGEKERNCAGPVVRFFYKAHVQSLAMLGPGPIVVQTEAALGWNVFPSGVGAASWS